jgi:hypothetical protein
MGNCLGKRFTSGADCQYFQVSLDELAGRSALITDFSK